LLRKWLPHFNARGCHGHPMRAGHAGKVGRLEEGSPTNRGQERQAGGQASRDRNERRSTHHPSTPRNPTTNELSGKIASGSRRVVVARGQEHMPVGRIPTRCIGAENALDFCDVHQPDQIPTPRRETSRSRAHPAEDRAARPKNGRSLPQKALAIRFRNQSDMADVIRLGEFEYHRSSTESVGMLIGPIATSQLTIGTFLMLALLSMSVESVCRGKPSEEAKSLRRQC